MAANKVGNGVAKALGIKTDYRDEYNTANDSSAHLDTNVAYIEEEPTFKEWVQEQLPTRSGVKEYIVSLFPFAKWILHYNLIWFMGDFIAGVTVGIVVIPQGMAYALLAKLPAEYGLYTSFVGFLLYWAFATSKDITIGTVAVMSTIVGNIVIKVQAKHKGVPAEQIARALSVIVGSILLFLGLTRLGWIVEFIPLVAITAFMTGAAINIAVGQVPALLGIAGINTREETYKVVINTLKALPKAKLDAAMGMTALFLLYAIRIFCNFMTRKQPNKKKFWFFMSTLRMAFVILLYTLISWLVNRHVKTASKAKFKILGVVPRGFKHAGAPVMNTKLISMFASDIPVSLIVVLIEHIAISKSFGRVNNYTINPSQELVALGFTNILGPFLGAYPATGSFSRTAIKSKAGVRTPLAGLYTAIVVLLALYALTSVFFYIPSSSLSALIIHAVGDLITPPNIVYGYWQISPAEVFIFFTGVFVTIFSSIENGIYTTIGISAALLLYRVARSSGTFLGRVQTHTVQLNGQLEALHRPNGASTTKDVYIPVNHEDGANKRVQAQSPYPGVFIYRFSEGLTYANQAQYLNDLTDYIFKYSRRTQLDHFERIGDRPWNDPGPRRGQKINLDDSRPTVKAVILDFSSVHNIDITAIQGLIDVRNQLDRYASPDILEWHFASINSRWTKRALAAAGFGYLHASQVEKIGGPHKNVVSIAELSGAGETIEKPALRDEENKGSDYIGSYESENGTQVATRASGGKVALYGINRPFFHIDVSTAVANAVANAERKVFISPAASDLKGEAISG